MDGLAAYVEQQLLARPLPLLQVKLPQSRDGVGGHVEAREAQVDALVANLKASGEAKKGDVIHLDFTPDAGTRVVVNGKQQGNAIAGEDFYSALLRIWLGDKPADGDLKKGLVGA